MSASISFNGIIEEHIHKLTNEKFLWNLLFDWWARAMLNKLSFSLLFIHILMIFFLLYYCATAWVLLKWNLLFPIVRINFYIPKLCVGLLIYENKSMKMQVNQKCMFWVSSRIYWRLDNCKNIWLFIAVSRVVNLISEQNQTKQMLNFLQNKDVCIDLNSF